MRQISVSELGYEERCTEDVDIGRALVAADIAVWVGSFATIPMLRGREALMRSLLKTSGNAINNSWVALFGRRQRHATTDHALIVVLPIGCVHSTTIESCLGNSTEDIFEPAVILAYGGSHQAILAPKICRLLWRKRIVILEIEGLT